MTSSAMSWVRPQSLMIKSSALTLNFVPSSLFVVKQPTYNARPLMTSLFVQYMTFFKLIQVFAPTICVGIF